MLPLTPITLLVAQIFAHIGLVYCIFFGTLYWWLVIFLIYFFTGCIGMTMTYHRLLSHRSWKCPKGLEMLFVIITSIGLTGSALSWVSTHRKHHRFADTDKDPHSPKHKSFFYCHFLSMFSKVEIKYAPDLVRQKFYILQHKYYFLISFIYVICVMYITNDVNAIFYAWLAPAAILWNAGSLIVSMSHRKNTINNDLLLAILVWGEGYHKNHHISPQSFQFGKLDLGGILIEQLIKLKK